MRCEICGKEAVTCISKWPDDGEVCLCREHATEDMISRMRQSVKSNRDAMFFVSETGYGAPDKAGEPHEQEKTD